MGKKAALHNLGCKVNAYETEAMRQLLEEAGYEIVPFAPGADVYVINTCTVTNIADRKSRQMLHKARKMNPDAIVVATGCYVQTTEHPLEEDGMADLVLGNNCKKDLVDALRMFESVREGKKAADTAEFCENAGLCTGENGLFEETDGRVVEKIDINHNHEYENLSITRTEEHTRAYIKVQDGCNQFCTYCIIPYARGRVRSRRMEDILREIEILAENGCREVVLTGIHLSSYGSDFESASSSYGLHGSGAGASLLSLIQAVHEVPGIARIRLGSLEPGIVTEEFADSLCILPKVCPHFHLSLQSGCTSVLKRMNRRYTAEEFEEKCNILRKAFNRPAITTDVIVGFPQETQEEFHTTVNFLEKLHLYETHIFKYSRRQGTRAAAMPGQLPETEKGVRSNILIELGERNRSRFEEEWAGKNVEVLFEEKARIDGAEYFLGYTKEYIRMAVPAKQDYSNQIITGDLGKQIAPHIYLLTHSY
ncbi:MAG: tRNA (N(6)-L-threonylcarbamoyladenosine(37)-C(2))-methylthiotransferase MtaB [Clostridiales bacterium]|nr:tRNA (N(6)-L-threonylcarbamoyladenosine(37)-C(2))-methylthiotransferase MtaB [Clostridiales bacterium]